MTPPTVGIVVLTYNGRADTIECLESLSAVTEPIPKILLVDNGSADGTADAVRRGFPGIEVIETGKNLGYAGGNNAGIRRALEQGAEYVLVLNNDTVVDPRFLAELLAVATREEKAGFVSPKIYFMESPDTIWFAGARYFPWCGYGRMTGYRARDGGRFGRVREIDRPCGCAVLVSRALCEEVGLMDPSLFLYMEEVEWMLRAEKKGFKAYLAPKARVWHKVSASLGGEGSPDALYYGARNSLYALRAHRPAPSAFAGGVRTLLVAAVFLLSALRPRAGIGERFRAVLDGVGDFRRSRMGRRGEREG